MESNRLFQIVALVLLIFQHPVGIVFAEENRMAHDPQLTDQVRHKILARAYDLQMPFIANAGQVSSEVDFYVKTFAGSVYVTSDGEIVYTLSSKRQVTPSAVEDQAKNEPVTRIRLLKERLSQANCISPVGGEKSATDVNYFTGSTRDGWKTHVPSYKSVSLGEVYERIYLVLRAHGNNVEKIFTVHPGGNVDDIQLALDGATRLSVSPEGELVASDTFEIVNFSAPFAFQEIGGQRQTVQVAYAVKGKTYGFQVGEYNREFDLVIDPTLVYSKILGGFNDEYGYGIAVDGSGNAYVAGYTQSDDFPLKDPYDATLDGFDDAFVSKFSPNGTLVYSTYLGGNNYDKAYDVALDSDGNIYITGETSSEDFPTQNAYDDTLDQYETNAFVTKLNAAGDALVWSTYLGGSGTHGDIGYGIAVDDAGNAYVTGLATSTDFPVNSAIQASHGGGNWDGFVTRLNAAGNTLDWSTYLGGSVADVGWGIAVDGTGNAYVTGYTNSGDFPTKNALQSDNAGGSLDVFVSKLGANGALGWSTYLGGSGQDSGNGIAVDSGGNVYVTGYTQSGNFPTHNPYDNTLSGTKNAFVSKLNASGSSLAWSTYLGGDISDTGHDIAVDKSGNVYVTGETASTDFPTQDPFQSTWGGDLTGVQDVFISVFNASGSALIWSTYLGRSYPDIGRGIAVGMDGNIYVTGETGLDFPADNIAPVKVNAFVSKFTSVAAIGLKAMPWLQLLLEE